MAITFGLSGWFFAQQPWVVATSNWWLARDYQPTNGTPIKRTGKDDNGAFEWLAVRYDVAGKTFETQRMTVLEDEAIDEPANAVVQRMLANTASTTVWVSPRNAEIAVVDRDFPFFGVFPFLPMAIGFAVLALGGLCGALGAAFDRPYYKRQWAMLRPWMISAAGCALMLPALQWVLRAEGELTFVGDAIVFFAACSFIALWIAVSGTIMEPRETPPSAKSVVGKDAASGAPTGSANSKRSGRKVRANYFDKD